MLQDRILSGAARKDVGTFSLVFKDWSTETQNKNPTVSTGDLYEVAAGCPFFVSA